MEFLKWFLIILTIIVVPLLVFHLLTRKYINPYKLYVIFGPKGSGKSCSMQKDLIKHHKRGWHCFADSNTDLPFVKYIDAKQLYNYTFPKNSFIVIDEVNLLWDNRDFKSFDPRIQSWLRQQRKFHCKIYMYSQTFDADKKIRDLADRLAIQSKFARVFTVRTYYTKTPRILSAETTREAARIADDYIRVPFLFGGKDICYMPKYIKTYNTDEVMEVKNAKSGK